MPNKHTDKPALIFHHMDSCQWRPRRTQPAKVQPNDSLLEHLVLASTTTIAIESSSTEFSDSGTPGISIVMRRTYVPGFSTYLSSSTTTQKKFLKCLSGHQVPQNLLQVWTRPAYILRVQPLHRRPIHEFLVPRV